MADLVDDAPVEDDDEQGRNETRKERVDGRHDAYEVLVTRQRRARGQLAEPNDVMSPRGRRVESKCDDDDDGDDDARSSLGAELVLVQRVMHDDVALSGEDDHVPGGQEAADARRVQHRLTPAVTREQADIDALQRRDRPPGHLRR